MKVEEAFEEWSKVIREINEKIEQTAKKTGMMPELEHNLIMNYFGNVCGSSIGTKYFKKSDIQ